MRISTQKAPTSYTETAVRDYMVACLERGEHIDVVCGGVNLTALAEDACQHFDAYGKPPTCACPDEFFEVSYEVGTAFEDALDEEEKIA